ncbi:MAG TPA: glucose PTS transporter subunit IIA, partial [Woeseiaceae bacterium]|nr:glucose PTS transporter subunit IIA [Woeseiaceae bacterium]
MTRPADALLVTAPLSGWCASLDDSPDPVFHDRILGDGVSIDPTSNDVLAPFDAEILNVPDTGHAVSLKAENGAEFLIHIGIDTVALAGKGFTVHARSGDRVKKGQRILSFDMDQVLQTAVSLRTPVLLLHNDAYALRPLGNPGPIRAGDALFEVTRLTPDRVTSANEAQGSAQLATVVVGLAHGIHARPAALLIESIKAFDAVVTCTNSSGKAANGRSAVALMALGVKQGDRIEVSASGRDAAQALAAFLQFLASPGVTPSRHEAKLRPAEPAVAPPPDSVLRAQSAGTGLAIGPAHQVRIWTASFAESSGSPAEEQAALGRAIAIVREFLLALRASQEATGRAIAEAHLALLEDPTLAERALADIRLGATA